MHDFSLLFGNIFSQGTLIFIYLDDDNVIDRLSSTMGLRTIKQ